MVWEYWETVLMLCMSTFMLILCQSEQRFWRLYSATSERLVSEKRMHRRSPCLVVIELKQLRFLEQAMVDVHRAHFGRDFGTERGKRMQQHFGIQSTAVCQPQDRGGGQIPQER